MHTVCKMFCVIATDTSGTCQVYRWSFAASVCWPGCVLLETPLNHAKRWNKAEIGFYTSCSDISQRLPQKFSKVAHFTKKLLKSCFLSTQKNRFLLLMKVNLCTSIQIIYLIIYSFLLADISIPTRDDIVVSPPAYHILHQFMGVCFKYRLFTFKKNRSI